MSDNLPPDDSVDRAIALHLALCRTASLATADAAGVPHAANIQVAPAAGLSLLWVSSPEARHSHDLAARPEAAVTLYAHDDRPDQIRGLQLRGRAAIADSPELRELYLDRFDFLRETPDLKAAFDRQTLYRFTPTWVRWIDNRRGFGWNHTWSPGGSAG